MKMIHRLFACLCALGIGAVHAAKPEPEYIEGSYIVTFHPTGGGRQSPVDPPNEHGKKRGFDSRNVPFGEHSTGQSKQALAATLGIKGRVKSILETINAATLEIDADEAEKLRKDPRVLRVEQNMVTHTMTTQWNPGWGLDRLDQPTGMNGQYVYNTDGAGRIIVVLDTGINLGIPAVAEEFGGRAQMFFDFNPGGTGADCLPNGGHGTAVASAAAGKTYGAAKGARVLAVKITTGCTGSSDLNTWVTSFNWLAANAPRGTIVNLSHAVVVKDPMTLQPVCSGNAINLAVEDAVRAAYRAGVIVVVAAGNDGCDTANYTPTRLPEAFVVGATDNYLVPVGRDVRAGDGQTWASRFGTNISTFSPGANVALLNNAGLPVFGSGTSFAAPYMSGMFAAACQFGGDYRDTMADSGWIYSVMRSIGTMNTVVEPNGMPPPGGTPSRFITRGPW